MERNPTSKPLPQACVVPFRKTEGRWEFCLITSLKKQRWIFPKGIVDPGETPAETGAKEAWEEAGLRGHVIGSSLGTFDDRKWNTDLHVEVMLMHVTETLVQWPEEKQRLRAWLPYVEAMARLKKSELRQMLKRAHEQLETDRSLAGFSGGN